MVSQNIRIINSILKQISPLAKLRKFGISSKGQPWISYQINGKVCCQFVSKKMIWGDKVTADRKYLIALLEDSPKYRKFQVSGSVYAGPSKGFNHFNHYLIYRSDVQPPHECSCGAGNCDHKMIIDRTLESAMASELKPIGQILSPDIIAQHIWESLPPDEIDYQGLKCRARKINPGLRDWIPYIEGGSTEYKIIHYNFEPFLVQIKSLSATEVSAPAKPSSLEDIWRSDDRPFISIFDGSKAKRISILEAEDLPLPKYLDIFIDEKGGRFLIEKNIFSQPLEVIWFCKDKGKLWESTLGDQCLPPQLHDLVKGQLKSGYAVSLISFSGKRYTCYLAGEKVEKNLIA